MTEYPDYLDEVLERFKDGWPKIISCDSGWFPLIQRLHQKIVLIDPDYEIVQVKEKFGGLRFYYTTSNSDFSQAIDKEIRNAERISILTCEITGKPGELMKRYGQLKTLHHSYASKGWVPLKSASE